jgi:alkylation response protein AidB-like acyl-CoA dehydrogenase
MCLSPVTQGETQVATITAEDLTALTDSVHRLLQDKSTETDVRRTMETPEGYDPALWAQLAEMGVVGVAIDEEYGGVGAGPVALERVMEEAGAVLLCSPVLSSVLAGALVQALGDDAAKSRLLPRIADGSKLATVALTGAKGGWTADGVAVSAADAGDAWTLDGAAAFVTHAQIANVILVVAKTGDGLGVFEVDAAATGLTIKPLPTFDHTLRLADLSFAGTPARRLTATRPAWDAVEEALALVRVALAGEQAGAAKRALEFTVDYAKTRAQFGRLIGSFQAIKHMAADLLLESESAISAARAAARSLADGAPDAQAAISLAAFACADAFSTITATAIQMHGGIAFTWAHPAHLYLRRARADAQLFGTPAAYRERYLEALGA